MILQWNPRYTVVTTPINLGSDNSSDKTRRVSGLPSEYSSIRVQYPRDLADALPEGSSARFKLKVLAPSAPDGEQVVLEKPFEPILLRPGFTDESQSWAYVGYWDYLVVMPPENWSASSAGKVIDLYRQSSSGSKQLDNENVWRKTNESHTTSDRLGIVFNPHLLYEFHVTLEGVEEIPNPEQYDVYLLITSGHRK